MAWHGVALRCTAYIHVLYLNHPKSSYGSLCGRRTYGKVIEAFAKSGDLENALAYLARMSQFFPPDARQISWAWCLWSKTSQLHEGLFVWTKAVVWRKRMLLSRRFFLHHLEDKINFNTVIAAAAQAVPCWKSQTSAMSEIQRKWP